MQTPFLIGLTGGIGAGKSFVATRLRQAQLPVYDCDQEALRIIHDNVCVRSQIEWLFGSDIFVNDQYDRHRVASLVFQDPVLLGKLNAIVHPAVAFDLQKWAAQQNTACVFFESAILFESHFDRFCDAILFVTAPLETRIQRVIERDHTTRQAVLDRIQNQEKTTSLATCTKPLLTLQNGENENIEALYLQIQEFCRTFAN